MGAYGHFGDPRRELIHGRILSGVLFGKGALRWHRKGMGGDVGAALPQFGTGGDGIAFREGR